jgi:hypothetical protein
MATTRKRSTSSSGFAEKEAEATTEIAAVEELLEETAAEMFETISRVEEEVKVEEPKVVAAPPKKVTFIPEEIIPTEDAGPRFVETVSPPASKPKVEAPTLKAPPKRHPRNVPRFSARK